MKPKYKEIIIKDSNLEIKSLIWENGSQDALVFVGGDGDDRFKFSLLIDELYRIGLNMNVLTFSPTGLEEGDKYSLQQQYKDLKIVMQWIIEKYSGKIALAGTSSGAYGTTQILMESAFSKFIKNVIYIDPADYYLSNAHLPFGGKTWSGIEEYKPQEPVVSDLIGDFVSDFKAHLINFTIRNYSKDGYLNDRGKDDPKGHPRLNDKMVRKFYENVPLANRGEYIETKKIPHAFMRDGDVSSNIRVLSLLIVKLLNEDK